MTGNKAGRAVMLEPCARQCGRRMLRGADMCGHCRKGHPALGEVRYCRDCGWPMRHALTRQRCGSCEIRGRHRRGIYANQKRGDAWTPEEESELLAMAGSHTAAQIGKKIGRSRCAVNLRAHKLGIYLQTSDWTQARLARLFGASAVTIGREWLSGDPPLLPSRKLGPREHALYGEWRIREADIEQFILNCPWAYDATRMFPKSHPLAQLALRVQRRDPWITVEQATRELGLSRTAVVRWCEVGVIPSKRRHVGPGGVHGRYAIRAADLVAAGEVIQQRQRAAREAIRGGLAAFNERRRNKRLAAAA